MSNVRFIGCLHFGHKALATWRGFQDEFYHDEYLISQWNKVVHKKDLTYILGDLTMETSKHYYQLDRLNGRKIVVLGNHDRHQDIKDLLKYVDSVAGAVDYKGCLLTHVPIHPDEIHFYYKNLHAHIHHRNKLTEYESWTRYQDSESVRKSTEGKYWCCDAHLLDYKPRTLEQLKEMYEGTRDS
jgi:calcineurin-like phosphoesterase family protein